MNACKRDFDKIKCISFSIKNEKLLEKYNEIWKKSQEHYQKKNWTVNLHTVKNFQKLK